MPPPTRSPARKGLDLHGKMQRLLSMDFGPKSHKVQLSDEDRSLLDEVIEKRKAVLGVSKSQEFIIVKKRENRFWALSRSTGSSPNRDMAERRNLEHSKTNALDVMDGLDVPFLEPN